MTCNRLRLFTVTCWCAIAASANLYAGIWAVPGVTNASEGGAHWATELRIQNRDSKPIDVTLEFRALGSETASDRYTLVLDPGQTLIRKNLLREVWQLEDQRGALFVETGGSATVTAFRYTDERDAVLGQALAAKPDDEWLSGADIGDLIWLAQTVEYESGVWVVLGSDQAQAEVVFFDATGKELARTTVEGASRSRWLALSDLSIQDQPIVRAQVRFLAGSGAASSEIAHLPTGDRMGADVVVVDQLQNDLSVHPAVRTGGFRTDLRLYNPSKRDISVSVTWSGKFLNVPLAAGQVVQVDDAAQALKLEGDQQGLLRISSGSKVVVLSRLLRLNGDGSQGPGELLAPQITVETGGSPEPWILAGVPEQADSLFLSLRRGPAASESKVAILDETGAQVASVADSLAVAGTDLQKLFDLLQLTGVSGLPAGATVSVAAQTGQVAPAMLGLLRGSGDIAHTTPARTYSQSVCVGPVIQAFEADLKTLEVPGPVTFSWRTAQAASVAISLDDESRSPSGSASLEVAETSTVILTASNACGEATRELSVVIGLPSLTEAQALAQSEAGAGSPGQLVRFAAGSLSEAGRVASILFRAPGGATATAEIERVDSQGRLYALVPYIWLEGAARYVKGEVTVSVVWDDGREIGALPFRILPLPSPADPLAMFRGMLTSLEEMAATVDAGLRAQGMTSLADAQKAGLTPTGAALRKLADDVAAKGSGSLFYSTVTTGATAVSTTVTLQDVEELMAYELNVRDAVSRLALTTPTESTGEPSRVRGAGGERAAGTCIDAKEPFIPLCKAINIRKVVEAASADRAAEFAKQFMTDLPPNLEQQGENAVRDWVAKKLAKVTLFGLLNRVQSYANYLNLVCLVRPIELDSFYLITQPPRRTTSKLKEVMYTRYDNQPTVVQVNAHLMPHYGANNLRDKLIAKEASYITKQLIANKASRSLVETGLRAFLAAAQGDPELKAVEAAAKALNFKPFQDYQVGKCDLVSFYPVQPGKSSRARASVRVASGFVQGEDNFYYLGSKMNTPATMCILPFESHFIFSEKVELDSKARRKRECGFSDIVGVSSRMAGRAAEEPAGAFLLPDFTDDVHVGPSEGLLQAGAWTGAAAYEGHRPSDYNPGAMLTAVTDSAPWVQQQSSGPASSRVVVKKVAKNKWEIEGTSNGDSVVLGPNESIPYNADLVLDTELTIPENRSGTYQLKMEVTVQTLSGICALAAGVGNGSKGGGGNNYGNGVSESSPRLLTYSLTAESEARSASLSLAMYASSGSRTPSSCKAKGTIELILPEE